MQVRICFESSKGLEARDVNEEGYASSLSGSRIEWLHANIGWELLTKYHNVNVLFFPAKRCGTELIRNHADVYPIRTTFAGYLHRNFTQGPISDQLDWTLISAYKQNSYIRSPDLMEFVTDYTITFVMLLLLASLLIIFVSRIRVGKSEKVKRKTNKKHKQKISKNTISCWTWSQFMLGVYESNIRSKTIIMTLVTISLANRIYAGMTMKTEQVVRTPGSRLKSVSDVLDNKKVNFAWLSGDDYWNYVNQSMSPIAKLMDNRNDRFPKEQTFYQRWEKPGFRSFLTRLYDQKHAVIYRRHGRMEIHRILCALSFYHKTRLGMHRMIHSDIDDGPHPLMGILLNTHFVKNSPAHKYLHRAISKSWEGRLPEGLTRTSLFPPVIRFLVPRKEWPELKQCYNKIGEVSESRMFVPDISSMGFLLGTTLSLLLVSGVRLVVEKHFIIHRHYKQSQTC
jgi:hypothetical protein